MKSKFEFETFSINAQQSDPRSVINENDPEKKLDMQVTPLGKAGFLDLRQCLSSLKHCLSLRCRRTSWRGSPPQPGTASTSFDWRRKRDRCAAHSAG